ncbi:hypothetical protein KSP40_PGU013861 [Platanthera guangdongensis]|uniref:Uncharacterized protein n=1 Tax=Platanthera guangdongensis TaxID=2320717 RepID=A0ABR2MTT8_9ASPA
MAASNTTYARLTSFVARCVGFLPATISLFTYHHSLFLIVNPKIEFQVKPSFTTKMLKVVLDFSLEVVHGCQQIVNRMIVPREAVFQKQWLRRVMMEAVEEKGDSGDVIG